MPSPYGGTSALADPDAEIERALRDSETRYRRLFEAARDGILILDADAGQIVDVNPFLLDLLGFSRAEVMGRTIGELSPFRDLVQNRAVLERLKETGYVRYEHLPLQTKDGGRVAVEFVCNVYQAGGSRVIQCNIRDITERKRLEARLDLLDACISNLNEVVLITEALPLEEPGPRIVFVNAAFERVTGYTPAEAMGRSPRFLQGKGTDRAVTQEVRDALEHRHPIRRQVLNYRKDGSPYWCEIDIVPILGAGGACEHFVSIQRDVTESRKAEQRFRRLVDSNAQGVMFWDDNGLITGANDAFLCLVGYTREALAAGRMNWRAMTPPEFAEVDKRAVEQVAATGICVPYEKELIRKDGALVPVLIGAAVFEDSSREGVSFIVDLTERKRLERQFLRAQRMEGIGTLAGGIAHDLNNILAPILMIAPMLRDNLEHSERDGFITIIEQSAKRGASIIKQLLTFSRGSESVRGPVQARHLVKEMATIMRETFPREITIETDASADLWPITADATQIHQILMNLCLNARDAMPVGGTLTLAAKNVVAGPDGLGLLPKAAEGHYICLTVSDTGEGILPENLDRIFEPFFTTKEIGRGTGLGLATVLGIVNGHEGHVTVYSEPSKGTSFKVFLPAISATPSVPARAGRRPPAGRGELILIVDDEPLIRTALASVLTTDNYLVLSAADGLEAVNLLVSNQEAVKLVITDIMMPGINGVALLRALRGIKPGLAAIAASGLHDGNRREELALLGVTGVLEKPFSPSEVLEAVRRALPPDPNAAGGPAAEPAAG